MDVKNVGPRPDKESTMIILASIVAISLVAGAVRTAQLIHTDGMHRVPTRPAA